MKLSKTQKLYLGFMIPAIATLLILLALQLNYQHCLTLLGTPGHTRPPNTC